MTPLRGASIFGQGPALCKVSSSTSHRLLMTLRSELKVSIHVWKWFFILSQFQPGESWHVILENGHDVSFYMVI